MYETKRAFTYLLPKESVANDVINVSLFAHDKITLKTQNVNKRRQDIDKNVWESKKYGVQRLIKEFSNKKWSRRGVEDFQKRLRTTGSTERAAGSGRPRTTRTAENVDAVGTWRTRMWANAQRNGRPAEYRWRPLFNAVKFG